MLIKNGLRLSSLILLFAISCSSPTQFHTRSISSHFQMDLADYLAETHTMNADAVLQLENKSKNVYMLVRENPWEPLRNNESSLINPLEAYYLTSAQQILGTDKGITIPDSIQINGLPALQGTLAHNFDGEEIVYELVLVEGKSFLYQILAWTLSENYEKHQGDLRKMIASFSEIDKS
ncbi:MAG: hypothetical protein AAF206_26370 [Bacteroidota bacterium]